MFIVGLDLGKHKAQVHARDRDGKIVLERSVVMSREELGKVFAKLRPARVLVESSTSSEWVARFLEKSSDIEVVVADPNFSPMYSRADKRIKTDKRDARALCEALKLGAYRAAHRRSKDAWLARTKLAVRAMLVGTRTRMVNQVRAALERDGFRVGSGPANVPAAVRELDGLGAEVKALLEPLLAQIESLTKAIDEATEQIEQAAAQSAVAVRLDRVVGIGPLTALAFVAVVEDVRRFQSVDQLSSYLGLVPRQYNSGDTQGRFGGITKSGDALLRGFLIESAWTIWRSPRAEVASLRRWMHDVAERRGKMRAAVALARRLARILFAIWRDNAEFDKRFFIALPEATNVENIEA